jgi:23S rRNA pseudouridine1911/1915/1917 synthase
MSVLNAMSIPDGVAQGPGRSDDSGACRLYRTVRLDVASAGLRLDQALALTWGEFSRGRIQQWIEGGQVRVDGRQRRCRERVCGGESVVLDAVLDAAPGERAQPIPLGIVYEDAALLVVDKPAGLVVHPAAGNPDGTLLNALLHHAPGLDALPRAGIVHRLDKDTSGLLVVAKTLEAHCSLVEQLKQRTVHREYRALVVGELVGGGIVEAPIGRHPTQRTRMAVVAAGRPAITRYRVLERYPGHSLLGVELATGRTHQIRVHLAYVRHPLIGDPAYGVRPRPPRRCSPALAAAVQGFPRQALHAIRLGLNHPVTGRAMAWEVPMAPDLEALLTLFRREEANAAAAA